ncbi:hypothetical protein F0562_022323 [Nyssa sinensis]|uniref:Uncharacterized protein n=1 Tax=Nyssa sinensis TaxID=561372 RepID=A0A5J5BSV0_9ASTE|nr:hypothetical protein F0562_022323 [Nyssa sinensis]
MASPIQIVTPVVVLVIVGVAGLVIKRCFYDDDNDEDRVDCCNTVSPACPNRSTDPIPAPENKFVVVVINNVHLQTIVPIPFCTRKPICGGGD